MTPAGTSSDSGATGEGDDVVTMLDTPIHVDYRFTAGLAQSRFLKGIAEGRFLGQRCPKCNKVYVPPAARAHRWRGHH